MEPPKRIMEEANFWASRIVLTAAELDVFTHLDRESLTASQFARRIATDPRATDRLLNALVALDLLRKHDDAFILTEEGRRLSSECPETLLPVVLHFNDLWEVWGQLTKRTESTV